MLLFFLDILDQNLVPYPYSSCCSSSCCCRVVATLFKNPKASSFKSDGVKFGRIVLRVNFIRIDWRSRIFDLMSKRWRPWSHCAHKSGAMPVGDWWVVTAYAAFAGQHPLAARTFVSTFIYRHLQGNHDQQRFTIRSGVLTGKDTRRRSAIIGSPSHVGPRSLQL